MPLYFSLPAIFSTPFLHLKKMKILFSHPTNEKKKNCSKLILWNYNFHVLHACLMSFKWFIAEMQIPREIITSIIRFLLSLRTLSISFCCWEFFSFNFFFLFYCGVELKGKNVHGRVANDWGFVLLLMAILNFVWRQTHTCDMKINWGNFNATRILKWFWWRLRVRLILMRFLLFQP